MSGSHVPQRAARGFTLLEVAMTLPILLVIASIIVSFGMTGSRIAADDSFHSQLEGLATRAVELMVDDIRRASSDQLVPENPVGTETTLQLLPIVDLDRTGGTTLAGNPVVYALGSRPAEILGNGLDDDNNGLVDDGILFRRSADGAEAVIATGVRGWDHVLARPAPGFRFARSTGTNRLRIALTLQRVREGAIIEKTHSASVTIRN